MIHSIFIGQPQTITDAQGTWRSSIFRTPVTGAADLTLHGLAGDQVTDTANHGSPDQSVCCHLLDHYSYWNGVYGLIGSDSMLRPGSVGENWTLSGADETDTCIGDIFAVGTARVQVSGPRYPCMKQERKVKLPAFHKRTLETLRTGFYLRVLSPGVVQAGDQWQLEERRYPDLTQHLVNVCAHHAFDPVLAQRLVETPELGSGWKKIFRAKLAGRDRW